MSHPQSRRPHTTLQMKGRWESNIYVWLRFMYSQKWNCSASLFTKHNYNVLYPSFTYMYLWAIYIFPGSVCLFLLQPNRQTNPENISIAHRHMNVGIGNKEAAQFLFLGIHKSDFRYSTGSGNANFSRKWPIYLILLTTPGSSDSPEW
jgi:hypothetical protein